MQNGEGIRYTLIEHTFAIVYLHLDNQNYVVASQAPGRPNNERN